MGGGVQERYVSIIHEEPLRSSSLGQQEREASEELGINKGINYHTDFTVIETFLVYGI